MSIKSVKAYANFPVHLRIEKDRYWYINELVSVKQNTTLVKNLQLFEGLGHTFSSNVASSLEVCPPVITIQEGTLWDYSFFNGGHGVMAPKGKTYYLLKQVFDNVMKSGTPVISDFGIYSDISAANNVYTTFNPGSNPWKIVMWVHTPAEGFGEGQCLLGHYSTMYAAPKLYVDGSNHLVLSLASSTSSYDIADGVASTQTLSLDKDYRITVEFDGQKYTVKAGYNSDMTQVWTEWTCIEVESSASVYGTNNQFCIGYCSGGTAWGGSIDLSRFEIFVNSVLSWSPYHVVSSLDEGILDVTTDSGEAAEYSVFVKNDGAIELSSSDEDKEGYYWAGTVNVPAHSAYSVYVSHVSMGGGENVTIIDHQASGFSATKHLEFNFTLNDQYFAVPYTILSKFTYSNAGYYQTGMFCFENGRQFFKVNNSRLALYDGADRGLIGITNGKTYWVMGNYVVNDGYSLYFIEDNGYTEETLPALLEWTFVYKTTETMLSGNKFWIGNNTVNQCWTGSIDLEHTCIKCGDNVLWRPFVKI